MDAIDIIGTLIALVVFGGGIYWIRRRLHRDR